MRRFIVLFLMLLLPMQVMDESFEPFEQNASAAVLAMSSASLLSGPVPGLMPDPEPGYGPAAPPAEPDAATAQDDERRGAQPDAHADLSDAADRRAGVAAQAARPVLALGLPAVRLPLIVFSITKPPKA